MDASRRYPSKIFPPGHNLLFAGEIPKSLYYLKSGHVKHFIDSDEGRELIIHIYEPDSIFPLMWGINEEIPNYSLSTITECEISLIPKEEFVEFLNQNPGELFALTKRLLYGISGLSTRVSLLSLENARVRVASTLGYLHKRFGENIHFTHQDLAALTGLSRERISIEMKKLKDDGVINYERGVISITDTKRLSVEN